jgi:hypothetical protein
MANQRSVSTLADYDRANFGRQADFNTDLWGVKGQRICVLTLLVLTHFRFRLAVGFSFAGNNDGQTHGAKLFIWLLCSQVDSRRQSLEFETSRSMLIIT